MKIIPIATITLAVLISSQCFARPVVGHPGYRNTVVNPVVNPVDNIRPGMQVPDGLSVDERRAWEAAHPYNVGNNAIDRQDNAVDTIDDTDY